jgi:cytochrome c-type biogenesis protein CcsB
MKKINNILFSMQLTGILLLLFAISTGYATFIENDFGAETAKAVVYNATWFNLMLLLLAVNLVGSIIKNKMYKKEKWAVFLFHIGFLIIFIGAAITRYVGFEGMMPIREGAITNEMTSDKNYVKIFAEYNGEHYENSTHVLATPVSVTKVNDNFNIGDKRINIEVIDYLTNVAETWVNEPGGKKMLWIVASDKNQGRDDLHLTENENLIFGGKSFSLNPTVSEASIKIFAGEGGLSFIARDSVEYMDMASGNTIKLAPDTMHVLNQKALYTTGSLSFVAKQYYESAVKKLVSTELEKGMASFDAFIAKITVDDMTADLEVFGGKGFTSKPSEIDLNGVHIKLQYGSKIIKLPFSIKLNDFELERYPGSNSHSSYASKVTIIDDENDFELPYRIYMNHVLSYQGYRFFQSSYDQDEKGTVLSVNHDKWGTGVTYFGYFLMTLGMFAALFTRHSRFQHLARMSSKLHYSRKSTVIALMIGLSTLFSTNASASGDTGNDLPEIKKEQAEKFGTLLIQERGGRIKPVGSLASEVLRKISKKNTYKGQSPEQVFLGILVYPQIWQTEPLIKVNHPELQRILGLSGKYASFSQIIDVHAQNSYLIRDYVEAAYSKKPSSQSKFDKEVMKVDERINIFYMIYSGTFLRIFPSPNDENNKWVTSDESKEYFTGDEEVFVRGILTMYYTEVRKAVESNDWSTADQYLEHIKIFQKDYGSEVMPSESKVKLEIAYNKINIFNRLSGYYGIVAFVLLIFYFITLLNPKAKLNKAIKIGSYAVLLLFIVHTLGLIIRWYISGHAPWSDGYESMIYIGWATVLAGLIFMKKSEITLAITALLASIILMVAGLSWMDPEITNLVPVLKSYWLVIHVAIITASYGFLALGALLGFFNLVLINLKTEKNHKRLSLTITELSYIIEMTLIIGLYMLTIGTFLGAVWANESWGRYWGWDPKETWALVTILIYAFVIHMRLIPGFKSQFVLSFGALISFGSVLMTYFGVNYYLSGLHSYAKGDPVSIPSFVYYTLIVIAVVSIMAYITDRKFKKTGAKEVV